MNQSRLNYPHQAIRKGSDLSNLHYLVAYFILFLAILLAYYPAFDNSFVHWDDQYYITQNIYIAQPTIGHLQVLLTKAISLNYHPITMISLWCNSYLSGVESAAPFIITNVIIHALASIALLHVSLVLTKNNHWLSLLMAIVFAIHPMHVESVVWISERKDTLYALFFFLAMYHYLRYADNDASGGDRKYYLFSLVFFVFSCLSKAMAVSFVPVLFLIDYYRGHSIFTLQSIKRKLPFIAIGILIGCLAVSIQGGGDFYGFISNTNLDNALRDENNFSLLQRWNYTGYSLLYYLSSFFYWGDVSAFHPYLVDLSLKYSLVPFLVIITLGVSYFKSRNIFFGLSFFIVTLLLVLPYVQLGSAVMADRYTYIPYVGLAYVFGIALQYLLKNNQKILYLVLGLISSVSIYATRSHADLWQNHTTLFENVIEKYPEDARSRTILATGYWQEEKVDRAITELEYAINKLGLYTSEGFENLATYYGDIGEKEKALAFYNHSLSLDNNNLVARYHRALLLVADQPAEAIKEFNICEATGDEYIKPLIYSPRGNCYGRLQRYQEAIDDFTKAIDLGQDLIISYEDRAMTYRIIGQIELAEKDEEMADRLKK